MAMTNAERMKKYREKIKKDKVKYEAMKAKARARNNSIRTVLRGASLAKFRAENKMRQQNFEKIKNKALKKVNSSLPKCGLKKKVIIQHIAQSVGLVRKSTHKRTTQQLADKLKNDVHNFYLRDDVSYQLPGKRDTVVVKEDDGSKVTYQKRILFNNLRENYELFKEENKNVLLNRTSFAELRPPFVVPKAALAHRNCLCLYHENIGLLLKSIDKYVDGKFCSSLQIFTDSLVCSTNNEECMFSSCSLCEDFFTEKVEENVSDGNAKITWSQWINENGCAEKKGFSGSVDEAREQSKFFEKLKEEASDEKIVLQVDFAENFNMKEQDEIQKAHWNSKPLSIFTAYVWSKNENFAFALPSSDITHDKFVVDAALEIILNHIVTILPNIKVVDCFSDGAASQFKQRFHFRNLVQIANEHNIALSWHFFATSHGKGVVDGIGGTVKRLVWSAILGGGVCRSAEDFIKIAKKKTKKVILIEITKNNIDNSKNKLESIFKTAKSIPETLKMHSVKVVDNNTLEFRYYSSCFQKKTVKY
ncbi:unnamed protein product [Rotaria sp. Silwood1]|nr:unnamed protein product [Rotaria sp. Silwood1]CAF1604200.1 unnamed protein product [Rotaria sp. Silwood1]CAF3684577.1 unnamed protein product [Rotaria sp. Silwood1]CAF3684685.1 unnamed protein product [Rotaria sp. Silwood1]CAF3702867.1 unnamed protein product [Rotaria sp. Silwood1]